MHQEQRDRTHALMQEKGINRALFANNSNTTWLTGVPRPWRIGWDFYAGGPSLVWYEEGHFTFIVQDSLAADAKAFAEQPGCAVVTYRGYSYQEQPAGAELLAQQLEQVVKQSGSAGEIGVERKHLPVFLYDVLVRATGAKTIPIDGWLDPLRLVRTPEELDKIRENFDLIKLGQEAAKEAIKPGNLEMDVWFAIHNRMQQAAKEVLPLGNDCHTGRRFGGPGLAIDILPTDSFIVDLSTLWKGYWSDSCVTYYAVEPDDKQIAMHRTVAEALELAISLVRPGAIAREIDQQVRQFLMGKDYPEYPHHTGHGVGVTGHENPRITPHSNEVLQAGMLIMLEPGIYYTGETGVRLEHAVLVTETGAEIFSTYDLNVP